MFETEEDQLLFSSLIKINYDHRFVRIVQDFIENLALLAGANKEESLRFSLLIEECLSFIIDKYIDCRMAAHIQICFKVTGDRNVRIEITDIGPPIHESMIPRFDITNENSEGGLWYKVVRELSDNFVFINQLGSGWLIQIDRHIQNVTFRANNDDNATGSLDKRSDTVGDRNIRWATVNDVPALTDLAYMTYRYSYVFKDFYDGELLKKYIKEKMYEVMLIEHGSKVVGTYAIKYSDAGYLSAEVGSAMISPEYRDGSAIFLMLRELNAYVMTNLRHCEFFVSNAVTSHILSQKGLSRIHHGFKPLMIFLNAAPRPEFMGIDHTSGGRESVLCLYHLNDKLKTGKIYGTAVKHIEIIDELIADTGNDVDVLAEFSEPKPLVSQLSVTPVDSMQFATISFESIGQDWSAVLSKKIFAAIVSGIETVMVTIPASTPQPADMERILRDLNLVFCGLSVRSLDKIDLAYCLSIKPVDFSLIKLYEPIAQKLLMHIEQDFSEKVVAASL
jgi:anti-sigma regulatory factor (Ser/Thr protein kinase)